MSSSALLLVPWLQSASGSGVPYTNVKQSNLPQRPYKSELA